jgi:hypothetical protein
MKSRCSSSPVRPSEHRGVVVTDDPTLAVDLVELHELDAVPDAGSRG